MQQPEANMEMAACSNCSNFLQPDVQFCTFCGTLQPQNNEKETALVNKWVWLLCIFYVTELIICTLTVATDWFSGFRSLMLADALMAFTAITFTAVSWQQVKASLRWPNFSVLKLFIYIVIAAGASILVQLSVGWLNQSIFGEDSSYYYFYSHTRYPLLWMLLSIALQPAVFEELGYRGFMYSGLRQLLDEKQSFFITAFAFALIHLSFMSFFWLLPFALWLGYLRIKENTIWYGVVIHFVFNAATVLCDYYSFL